MSHRAGQAPSRRWVLPAVVVLLWLVVGGPLASFAGKLASVQENDNAAFLPQSSESTRVLEALGEFRERQTVPVTVVFERPRGLTPADRQAIERYADRLGAVAGVPSGGVTGPVPSEDGEAAQLVVQVAAQEGEAITAAVEQMRQLVADPPDGLTALVGGQGGVLADFVTAFGAIDGLLLAVALAVVLVILLAVYRSPVLPLVVLATAVLALGVASAAIYAVADADLLTLNGQSQGILFILAVGAATDYALLVVARYREALRDHASPYDAMRSAYRGAAEPIIASGATVILGLLCLLLSDLASLSGLGPVGAFGIAAAMLACLTLLPAALVLLGRRAFWPLLPQHGSPHPEARGVWGRVARLVHRRARAVWLLTTVVLALAAGFATTLEEEPVPQTELFLTEVESVRAQQVLEQHFAADRGSPVQVLTPAQHLPEVVELLTGHAGVAEGEPGSPAVVPLPSADQPRQPKVVDGRGVVLATLSDPADSPAANRTVRALREDLDAIGEDVLVGGTTAIQLDTLETAESDRARVMPAILLVILVVLALLLRSLVAPLVLLAANVLSFAATVGVSALVFDHVFGFSASDPSVLLIGFVFLVALGIDYSIFLMTRVREESLRQGTRPGVLRGLSVTGGVITSAGVVLASTFGALVVIPLQFLVEIAFMVSFGVLLDTLVVRSLLVPALCHDLGARTWWPSRVTRIPDRPDGTTREMLEG